MLGTQVCIIVTAALLAAPAAAESRSVDWRRGTVSAPGAAAADIRTPSPTIARMKAHRVALTRARAALTKAARAVRWASGGHLAAQLKSPAQKARFDRAIARALPRDVHYASDGSVMLRASVPVEALRLAVVGAPAASPLTTNPITAIVVDARGLPAKLAIGLGLVAGATRYAGPTVYHRGADSARKDARLGAKVLRVKAIRITAKGDLQLAPSLNASTLQNARDSGALVAIVLPDQTK